MSIEAIVGQVIDAFGSLRVEYMLSGSLATNLYAPPRFTADADFVVELGQATITQIAKVLGPAFRVDEQLAFETNTGTIRQVFEHRESRFVIELFQLSSDPHDQERFRRRRRIELWNREVHVVTAEDIIIMKLRWLVRSRRPKDEQDVLNIIESQRQELDWPYVHQWCERHGTAPLLGKLRAGVGD